MDLDEKRRTILSTSGHLLIEGGPGSGKTTIALLLAQQFSATLGVEQKILFLSFSRAAVRQITDRMRSTLDSGVRAQLEIRTFHAFFLDLVRAHSTQLTGVSAIFIAPDTESQQRFDFDGDWKEHTDELAQHGQFVFDRLAPTAATMLETGTALCQLYSSIYPLVIVDEFQDTNIDQWRVVKALAEQSTVICLADPDQRIYEGFVEGVDAERLDHLRSTLTPKEFDLSGDNHRSPAAGILDYANAILVADTTQTEPPSVQTFYYSGVKELSWMTHHATAYLDERLRSTLGYPPTIAVLATGNYTVTEISQQLSSETETPRGSLLPPIDHHLDFEREAVAASGCVVASILEWPTMTQTASVLHTLEHLINYYRTIGSNSARTKAAVLKKACVAITDGTTVRSKAARTLIAAYAHGLQFVGDPVIDWGRARNVLAGAAELDDVAGKVRHLRLLSATDDLGWALLTAWDGQNGYSDAAPVVRQTLAERLLDDSRTHQPRISLMNMYRAKGKEFDGVIIAEGRYRDKLLDKEADFAPRSARRRLLRVGFTRARHQIILLRPRPGISLMSTAPPPI
ncbi:UvrD-helicase domain-containing protein [Mycobacteroides abscessus]|uniref:UvrD-helicase domain-containing protein n=1 Tax=Mycobacteroides abscessus TaxID=36809 RepID=UPI00177C1CC0|nr:ATP-dependent helicase [Mycobacteroides abscessus]QOF28779.1 hypothetical protein E3G43_002332 [Mycobacteroides abscessus]